MIIISYISHPGHAPFVPAGRPASPGCLLQACVGAGDAGAAGAGHGVPGGGQGSAGEDIYTYGNACYGRVVTSPSQDAGARLPRLFMQIRAKQLLMLLHAILHHMPTYIPQFTHPPQKQNSRVRLMHDIAECVT